MGYCEQCIQYTETEFISAVPEQCCRSDHHHGLVVWNSPEILSLPRSSSHSCPPLLPPGVSHREGAVSRQQVQPGVSARSN